MKKILGLLLIMCLIPFSGSAVKYPDGYPVIPEEIVGIAKDTFNVDDTNGKLLYEKVPISEGFNAWMLGWFWDNLKIVVGITDSGSIIYYNYSALNNTVLPSGDNEISKEEGFEIAFEFINRVIKNKSVKLTSSKAYTYNFAEYKGGIRIAGHDATVVVDKSSGKVYYYKGFGDYETNFELMEKLISKDYAYDLYFKNIGLELVYYTKYDSISKLKSSKPMYIFNGRAKKAVDAQTGEVRQTIMYDYNYYYNDSYYNKKFTYNNNINENEAVFSAGDKTYYDSKASEEKLKTLFYSLRNGYSFYSAIGEYEYYSEKGGLGGTFPVWQINIVPAQYINAANDFSLMYDKNDYDWLNKHETQVEYVFARAYINAQTGELLKFDNVPNQIYKPAKPANYTESDEIPKRIYEFAERATPNYNKLQFFGQQYENKYTQKYCFARYENGARVIGEGMTLTYNKYNKDITKYCLNMSLQRFTPLNGVKTITQMEELIKDEIPFELFYIDKDKNSKISVYDISEKSASFDPITGNRIDRLGSNDTTRIFICKVGSSSYTVNGADIEYAAPFIKDNKVYIPLRLFANELGYEINKIDNEITLASSSDTIKISLNSKICYINDKPVTIDSLPVITDDLTYLSSLSIANIFGMHTWWDEASNKIFILN